VISLAADRAPGVYVEFVDASPPRITGLPTDIAGFVGIADRGPVDQAIAINSWEQFAAVFGSFAANGFLAYAAYAFFQNGGRRCHIVRVADKDRVASASAVIRGEDLNPTLLLSATSPGGWGNQLGVRVGRSSAGATVTDLAKTQPADRWSSFVESVAGFERAAVVRFFQDGPPPLQTYRVVTRVEAPLYRIWWHAPIDNGFDLAAPLHLEVIEFSLAVSEAGVLIELYPRLSLVRDHPRYIAKLLAETPSPRIAVIDPAPIDLKGLSAGRNLFPERLPAPADLMPQGGVDGIAGLSAADFTGDLGASEKRGLRCLEDVEEVAIVAIPDCLIQPLPPVRTAPLPPPPLPDPCPIEVRPVLLPKDYAPPAPEPPPVFTLQDVFEIQQAVVAHCEAQRYRIAVLDAPLLSQAGERVDVNEIRAWRQRFDSKYAALYFPWLLVDDPLQQLGSLTRAVPPSGHVVGLYAHTDLTNGVHWAPANTELNWVRDIRVQVDAEVQAVLNPLGINCIRAFPARGLRVFGARTVSSDPDWRYVNVRRLMMMIEATCLAAMRWAVFEPNDGYLRELVRMSLASFLSAVWRQGALVGATAADAYYVKCDEANNPSFVVEHGQLIAEVGVAPVRPAEFVFFRIGRVDDELVVSE
jgi:phage tail sheath protein FI